jgi:hypothetical protein
MEGDQGGGAEQFQQSMGLGSGNWIWERAAGWLQ